MKATWFIGLVAAFLILVFVGYDIYLQKEYLYQETREDAGNLANLVEADLSRTLASFDQIFASLAEHLEPAQAGRMDSPGIRRVIDELVLRNNILTALLVLDNRGQVLHWNNNFQKPNLSQRHYFHFHKINYYEGLYVGLPQPSFLNPDQWIAGISKAIHHEDRSLDKVLVAIIDLKHFQRQYLPLFNEQGMILTISSPAGHVYARIPEQNAIIGQQIHDYAVNHQALASRNPLVVQNAADNYPFLVTVEKDPATLFSSWKNKSLMMVVIAAAFVLVLLFLTCRTACFLRRQRDIIDKLKEDTLHESVTHLLHLDRALEFAMLELKRAVRKGTPFSALMIGLEATQLPLRSRKKNKWRKQTKEVLECVAEVLQKSSRETDILSRYGDNEFLIFLPDTNMQGAMIYARKVRENLDKRHCGRSGEEFEVTFGIGVTQWSPNEADLSNLMHRLDAALYEARKSEPNTIRWVPHNLATEDTSSTVVWLHTKPSSDRKPEVAK